MSTLRGERERGGEKGREGEREGGRGREEGREGGRERERERGREREGERKGGREREGDERKKERRNSHTHKQGIHSNYYNYVKIFRTTHKINSEGFTHKAWDNPNPLKLNVYKQDHN